MRTVFTIVFDIGCFVFFMGGFKADEISTIIFATLCVVSYDWRFNKMVQEFIIQNDDQLEDARSYKHILNQLPEVVAVFNDKLDLTFHN